MKKYLSCIVFMLFAGITVLQAQRSIQGIVTNADENRGMPGVSVTVKGSYPLVGTVTDKDGHYSISAPSDGVLVFSYTGMGSQELELEYAKSFDVKMSSSAIGLDAVIVTAYGTTTKKSFTGAASHVGGGELAKSQTSNVTKALEGAVAGVQISSSTGQPGSSASIRIRGLGSLSASQKPLIVVDGVPYEGDLSSISPQDIESLSVLKDAASNSMYGARGSNGVILITTKKGNSGTIKVNVDVRAGINSRGVSPYSVVTSPADYYELAWESLRNGYSSSLGYYNAGVAASQNLLHGETGLGYNVYKGIPDGSLIDPATGRINPNANELLWTDSWLKEPFANGIRQEYNMNVSGGTDKTAAYLSLGYVKDGGYIAGSDFQRFNVRAKIDQQINKWIKAGVNVAYAKTGSNTPVESAGSSNYSNVFFFSQNIAPIYPVYQHDLATGEYLYDADGKKMYDFGAGQVYNGAPSLTTRLWAAQQNPLYKLQHDGTSYDEDNLSSRGYVDVTFLKDFTFTANVAYDVFSHRNSDYVNPTVGDGVSYGGSGRKEVYRTGALNANQLLNWSHKFGRHEVSALLGHEVKVNDNTYLYGSKMRFYDPDNGELANAGSMSSLTSYKSKYVLEGILSRAEYNYADKYYVSASFRRDASSKFSPDVRWGNFWSVGAAWRINEENFLSGVEAIDNLKLKASYGTQGNDGISINGYVDALSLMSSSNFYTDQYELVSDGTNASPVLVLRGNPELTWEKSNNLNIGLELGIFGRLQLGVDFFIKETKDLLYQKPLPPSLGSPTWMWDNQIDMRNMGVEVDVLATIVKEKNVKWDIGFNLTHYTNELTRLPADKTDPDGYVAGSYWRKLGGSIYDWYTYEYAGVDEKTGVSLWYKDIYEDIKDKDGNIIGEKITGREKTSVYADATRYETGKSAVPDFYGGLYTSLSVYGIDLSIQTAFQAGGWVYDNVYAELMGADNNGLGQNWSTDIFQRWTPQNTNTDIPRLSTADQNSGSMSTRFLTSASYFSLRNITLGYSLPSKILSKIHIEKLRIFLSADNVWLKSARKGLDPRQSFSGATGLGIYSAIRTTSIGVNVSF